MIECKTFGKEYQIEKTNVLDNGGQIFSYFTQDRTAEVIAIYTSKIEDGAIEYISEQVFTFVLDKNGDNVSIFQSWDKSFINNGIFDVLLGTYEVKRTNLRKNDLIDLSKDSGRSIFNEFAEILRKYVISDKSNAFNVIFNLFVCKIYDEDIKGDGEELDFQIKIGDDEKILLERLSTLYKESVEKYLSLKIDTKYFSSSERYAIKEFSFIDVFNDETFLLNSSVLFEVVLLLQKYRIKYSTKHQFLGEFFENLLNTGIKQESGQFFTPIPLSRFILKSLPLQTIIKKKIAQKDPYILPHVIDYACGAGHFLTEAIEEINLLFPSIDYSKLSGQQKRYFESSKNNYLWARDYIYGIEKDHRLAKTTKIAMFLNGDGDAFVLSGDGLDDFYYSEKYNQKLKSSTPTASISSFDIVVSNPPFSVDGFLNNVKNGETNFSSYKYVSQKSTEIECFFVERTIQLLKANGSAGIILPLSILNNNRLVYTNTRKLLLLYTEIISLVELREKAFMATGTATCIMFFRKRSFEEIENASNAMLIKYKNHEHESQVEKLLKDLLANYKVGNLDAKFIESEYFKEFVNAFLIKDNKTILVFSGEKKRQEFFLGYRFSKARGREGLSLLQKSLLYDYSNVDNAEKVDHYIRCAFNRNFEAVPSGELAKHLTIRETKSILSQDSSYNISNPSALIASKTVKVVSISPSGDFIDSFDSVETSIEELITEEKVELIGGLLYNKNRDEVPEESEVRVLTASNLSLRTGKIEFNEKMIHLRNDFVFDSNLEIKKFDLIMAMSSGSLKHLGKICISLENYDKLLIGGFLNILRPISEDLSYALYYRLMSKTFREYVFSKKGTKYKQSEYERNKEDQNTFANRFKSLQS
jgi:Type I restriction-modification system methyltransferase subunit